MPKIEIILAAVFDTHIWLWSAAGDKRASAIQNFSGTALIPAISTWEVSMLHMKDRVELLPDLETWMNKNLTSPATLDPLTPEIARTSCQLPDFHGDPADRLIVATAIIRGIPLFTADEKIIAWNHQYQQLHIIDLS